jgi:hypothetical protein
MQFTVNFDTLPGTQVLSFLTLGSRQRRVYNDTSVSLGVRTDLETIVIKKIESQSSSLTACSRATTLRYLAYFVKIYTFTFLCPTVSCARLTSPTPITKETIAQLTI